jgi:hypothetical protein
MPIQKERESIMKKVISTVGLVACAATALAATAATAGDRRATAAERAQAASVLSAAGFTSWRKIEVDDGKIEIDDARHANGRLYDVDIRGGSIVKKDLED